MISREVLCVECGYDLKGLPRRGNCPECGTPAKRSFAGPLLRHAGSAWLKRVWLGLCILHRASVAAVILAIVAPIIELVGFVNGTLRPSSSLGQIMSLVLSAWVFAAVAGMWLATARDPRDAQRNALQGSFERGVLMAIPLVAVAWLMLGIPGLHLFGRWSLSMITPAMRNVLMVMLFVVTWWQARTLARWLNRIDARVDPAVQAQQTIFDRINESVSTITSGRSATRWTADDWRGVATWGPIALIVFFAWSAWRAGFVPWPMLAIIIGLPVMILLTMRRTVRNVGVERATGEELHGKQAGAGPDEHG